MHWTLVMYNAWFVHGVKNESFYVPLVKKQLQPSLILRFGHIESAFR